MATYDRFAGIDDNYRFPPEVRSAIANYPELQDTVYKTGRRIISSLLREGVTGIASVSRTGDLVVLNLYGVNPPEEVSYSITPVFETGLPVGFRPDASLSVPLSTTTPTAPAFVPRVFMSANGICSVNTPGVALYGVITYRTNNAPLTPTTLPGTPG